MTSILACIITVFFCAVITYIINIAFPSKCEHCRRKELSDNMWKEVQTQRSNQRPMRHTNEDFEDF